MLACRDPVNPQTFLRADPGPTLLFWSLLSLNAIGHGLSSVLNADRLEATPPKPLYHVVKVPTAAQSLQPLRLATRVISARTIVAFLFGFLLR